MSHFSPALFEFLFDLDVHNTKEWMDEHRERYEQQVKQPLYDFCDALAEPLHARVSPHLVSIGRIQGGSVFQIHRDTRFSDDKRPYKSNAGAWFKHEHQTAKVATPGIYLHLEPGNCFMGGGIHRPPTKALTPIRERIVEHGDDWDAAVAATTAAGYRLSDGDALKTSPRGFDADDPRIEDLRRRSFTMMRPFEESDATADDFLDTFVGWSADLAPFLRFLADANDVPF